MMESLVGKIEFKETLKQHAEQLIREGSGILAERRQVALAEFERLGFPTTRNEEWKYTNVLPSFKKDYYLESSANPGKEEINRYLFPSLDGNILVFLNGVYRKELSTITEKSEVLEVKDFSELSEQDLLDHLGSKISVNDAFSALNTACFDRGIFLRIKKGKVVEQPIYLYFISEPSESLFVNPRMLVVAEENASAKISEIHIHKNSQAVFTNSYSEIILQQDAHLEYYKILTTGTDVHVGTTQVIHTAKSVFSASTISFGGNLVRNNMNIVLNAQHCDSTLYGLYVAGQNQHVDNHTLVDHAMPNCLSNELYKGVLNGKSSGVFNGKIFVRKDAQKTNAFQSNKNILLSKDASMNTKPQLEIFADDVKCSHGATIGQLDEEPLFYLRSRGLSEDSARAMLVTAFAQDIVDHIKIVPLKELLKEMLAENLAVAKVL